MNNFTTRAVVNLDAIEKNFLLVKSLTNAKICCVVKANAYGHGDVTLSRLYQDLSARFFAVSSLYEGVTLRKGGITRPILILGFTPPNSAQALVEFDLIQTVFSYPYALLLNDRLKALNAKLKVHVKIETGMNRLGFCGKDRTQDIYLTSKLSHLVLDGTYTHFSCADLGESGKDYTLSQFNKFTNVISALKIYGVSFNILHSANSAGIIDYPQTHLDMVRAGICLYGYLPSNTLTRFSSLNNPFVPAMTFLSAVAQVKNLKKGERVSYGGDFVAYEDMRVATIPVGYADGLLRKASGYSVLIKNKPCKIIGRICMDQFIADVSSVTCAMGDDVLIFGDHPLCSADTLSQSLGTINYEVLTSVSGRVPRVYIQNGKLI